MAGVVLTVLHAVWLFLPAYLANMSPVFVGGPPPIDGGRYWKDGRRILGDGKTWRGLVLGPLAAAGLTLVLHAIVTRTALGSGYGFPDYGPTPAVAFVMAYAVGFGALAGDVVESFFKRRKGFERGEMWLGFDQLDFVVGAFLVSGLAAIILHAGGLTSANWFLERWTAGMVLTILVLTPVLHLLVNWVGYMIGKKEVPW